MQLPKLPENANRKIDVVVTDITKCSHCTKGYIGEPWLDEYGSWNHTECQQCFLGMVVNRQSYAAVVNKNGTFSII